MGVSGIETPVSVTVTPSPSLIKHFAKEVALDPQLFSTLKL